MTVNAIPMRAGFGVRIGVVLGGVEHVLTLDEWRAIEREAQVAIDSFRVKCPTCRCRILPGQTCGCCASMCLEDLDDAEVKGKGP